MNILIAEDDFSSRKLLRHLIAGLPNFTLAGEAANGEELITKIIAEKPDIVLVDIGMPLLNGMDAIKSCFDLVPDMQVIFITGAKEYALDAFCVRAVDYILKPIERSRLYAALRRASETIHRNRELKDTNQKNLIIKQQQNMIFIPLEEIMFIERTNRKSIIHTRNNQYETYESLSSLETLLDFRFMKSHRSYIVNMELLERIEASGQSYSAFFKHYEHAAKISKNKIVALQHYKSNV